MRIEELTLEEKIKLVTAKDVWHFETLNGKLNQITVSDGPCGLRHSKVTQDGVLESIPTHAYISPSGIANSWNKEFAYLQGSLIAEDCIENDIDVILAPGVNIKRTPLCGRNFEYFSEDPFLAGTLAKSFIEGVQDKGIGTSLKHLACNNREIRRFNQSSEVDERTLHETYLEAFRIALEAKPFSVMTSYNPVNGIYAGENHHLLTDILRNEFHYENLVISDWGGIHNSAKAIKAGLNIRMPFDKNAEIEIKNGLKDGIITEVDLNNSAKKVLESIDKNEQNKALRKVKYSKEERFKNSLKFAEEAIVLLKNNDVLPLKKENTIFVSGQLDSNPNTSGTGSAKVKSNYTQKRISEHLKEYGYKCSHSEHNFINIDNPNHYDRETVLASMENDITILLVGEKTEGEGTDRETIKLTKKEEDLINQTAKVANKLIVIVECGSAIDMSEWIANVDGVIFVSYLGDNQNEAIANVLTGKVNPSGKLAETFPYCIEDTYSGTYTGEGDYEVYDDKIFVGYRHYDKNEIEPLFEFGYGLSYTNFEYSNLKIKKIDDVTFEVSYDITNIGKVKGKEISQVYVNDPQSMVNREIHSLKGYSKDELEPGETKTVKIILDKYSFAYYEINNKEYYVENGQYYIEIGASSKDIRLTEKIKIMLNENVQNSIK